MSQPVGTQEEDSSRESSPSTAAACVSFIRKRAARSLRRSMAFVDTPEPEGSDSEDIQDEADSSSSEDPDFVAAGPDLSAYLSGFGISERDQVQLCRSYENFVNAKIKPVTFRSDKGTKRQRPHKLGRVKSWSK